MISPRVPVIHLHRSICILIVALHLPGISSSVCGQDPVRDPVLLRLQNARCTTQMETINGVEAVVTLRYDAHQSPIHTSTEELGEILESLPELRELSLLNLYSGQDTLRHLKNLKQLRSLDLSMSQIPAESLKHLEHLPHLETLKLNYCFGLDDEDAMQYVSALPNLKQLELADYLLSDRWPSKEAWLKTVQRFFTLRQNRVYLSPKSVCNTTQKTYAGLPMLVRLKQLQHLKLNASSIDDQGLEYLLQLPNLTHLDLSYTSISDDGMIAIGELSKLRSLRLHGCLISDQGLHSIGNLVDLEELWLGSAWVTDQGLEQLRGCRSLKRINLANTLVTDESLQLLKSYPDLERLQASESKITLRGMFNLSAANPKFTLRSAIAGFGIGTGTERRPSGEKQGPLSTLKEMDMNSNPLVNDDTLAALHEKGFLSDLSYLDLSDTSVTDEGMVYLRDSTQLFTLDIERTSVTDEGLNWLKNLKNLRYLPCRESQLTLPSMIHLIVTLQGRPSEDVFTTCLTRDTGHDLFPTALDLHGMRISDDDLRLIVPIIKLDTINLSDNPLSDAGVLHVAKIPQLRQLWISGPRISGEGLASLQDCRSLETLWLTDTRATEDDLPALANMKQLRRLNLSGMTFTKKGIEQLQALSHLETLIVDSTALPQNEVNALKESNPELVIILSQKHSLAAVRGRDRTGLNLPQGYDRVIEQADVESEVTDHPLSRTFGDTHFEQAVRLRYAPNSASSLKDWKGLTTLRYVSLGALKDPSAAIAALKNLPMLEEIHLYRCTVSDRDFKDMGILPSVKKLDLYDNIISNTSLEYLSQLPNLESLGLYGYDVRISEAGLQNLSHAKSLTTLELSRTTITDSALAHFPCLQQLESLSLREVPIDSGITHLTRLPNLKTLDLYNTLVTDETLDSFQPNKTLRFLELAHTLVSESGIQRLQERMPDTQISGGRISEQARVHARLFGRLRTPMFRDHNDEIFMLDFRLRENLLETLPTVLRLKSLQQLRIGREATDEVLKQVAEISSLETINLWKSQVTENGLRSLLALPKLKNLYIVQTELSAEARSCLGEFTRLEGLSLIDTMVSDEDLSILKAMPHLQYLYLDGTQATKDGLKYIDELTELSTLSLKRSKIAPNDLKEFEERHPTCQVITED